MKTYRDWISGIIIAGITTALFFYQTILFGRIPFPGDLLAAEYKPWSSYSIKGYNPGAVPNKAQYFDTLRQLYPWRTLVREELKHFKIPLWNPYNFSGAPILANFQSQALYPLQVLTLPLPDHLAWTVLIILQPFLAVLFTFLYAKKIHLKTPGAVISSISYGFGMFMAVWLEYNTIGHVILWLPFLLYLCESIQEYSHWSHIMMFIFVTTTASFAGHPQVFIGMMVFVLSYAYTFCERKIALRLSIYSLLGLGIASIQWVPGIELMYYSARSNHTYDTFIHSMLIKPQELLMIIIPDIFGSPVTRSYWMPDTYIGRIMGIGIIPFMLAMFGITLYSKNRHSKFLIATILLLIILTTDNPVTRIVFFFPLPILSTSNPTLFLFLVSFALAILSGFGIDNLTLHISYTTVKRVLAPIGILLLACFLLVVALPKMVHSQQITQFKAGSSAVLKAGFWYVSFMLCFVIASKFRKTGKIAILIISLLSISELWVFFHKFNPFVTREFIYPDVPITRLIQQSARYGRVWGVGTAAIEANFGTLLHIFSPDGYDPLYPKWYGQFIQASTDGHVATKFTDTTRSDARITASFGKEDFITNSFRTRILNSISVDTIVDRVENGNDQNTFPPDTYSRVGEDNGWIIYKNSKASPRVSLYSSYDTYQTDREFEDKFFKKNLGLPLLSQHIPVEFDSQAATGTATIETYTPTDISIRSNTQGNQLLVLTDTFYPGWIATVDGNTTPIYKTNFAFRSIVVPGGNHLIRFSFDPLSFRIGMVLSCISLIVSAVICKYAKKETRAK